MFPSFSAVSRLQKVDLSCTYLETDQSVAVLSSLLSSSTLVDINLDRWLISYSSNNVPLSLSYLPYSSSYIFRCSVNLSAVDGGLLAEAVSRLKSVDLSATHLSAEQCGKLLARWMKIHSFILAVSYHSWLIFIIFSNISSLLLRCVESSHLVNMKLHFIELSGVPEDVVEKARKKFSIWKGCRQSNNQ